MLSHYLNLISTVNATQRHPCIALTQHIVFIKLRLRADTPVHGLKTIRILTSSGHGVNKQLAIDYRIMQA